MYNDMEDKVKIKKERHLKQERVNKKELIQ